MRKKELNRTDDDENEEGRTKIDEPKREGSVTRERIRAAGRRMSRANSGPRARSQDDGITHESRSGSGWLESDEEEEDEDDE